MARQQKKTGNNTSPDMSSDSPYEVEMTDTAATVYKNLARLSKAAESAGDYVSAHCTTFHMVQDAIKRIIPNDPLNKTHALRGDLSNIFRMRKGRLRICWIASSRMRRLCILFISESLRKEGDASDPYVIVKSLLDSGVFDNMIKSYGVRIPTRTAVRHDRPN